MSLKAEWLLEVIINNKHICLNNFAQLYFILGRTDRSTLDLREIKYNYPALFLRPMYSYVNESTKMCKIPSPPTKILKSEKVNLWRMEFHYTCEVEHPFLQFEVKNGCRMHLFM